MLLSAKVEWQHELVHPLEKTVQNKKNYRQLVKVTIFTKAKAGYNNLHTRFLNRKWYLEVEIQVKVVSTVAKALFDIGFRLTV